MKKNIFTFLLLSVFYISNAQISVKSCPFSINKTTAPNGTFTINLKIKNEGTSKNSGTFKFYWPEIANITIFPWQTTGTFKNDTLTLQLQSFFPLNNGETTYLIDGSFEQYIGDPEYAEFNGEKISINSCENYTPNWMFHPLQFNVDTSDFISSGTLHLGEARLKAWGELKDLYIPTNRKNWAIASAFTTTLFNNIVGKKLMNINYYNALAMLESSMGSDNGIINNPNAVYPITYRSNTVQNGFLQIESSSGYATLKEIYPTSFKITDFNDMVPGNKFSTSMLTVMYYNLATLMTYDKKHCYNSLDFFNNTSDKYALEQTFYSSYHNGFYNANFTDNIFKTHRLLLRNTQYNCLGEELEKLIGENPTVNLMQNLYNYLVVLNNETQQKPLTTLASNYDPNEYVWHQWYNADINWVDIENYLDEISVLYPSINFTNVKQKVQVVFNAVNQGNPIPYTNLGLVIDEMVKRLPAFDPNWEMGANALLTGNCNDAPIAYFRGTKEKTEATENTCGEKEMKLKLGGKGPWEIVYTNGVTEFSKTTNFSNDVLNFTGTGNYKITKINNATGSGNLFSSNNYPRVLVSNFPKVDLGDDINLYETPNATLNAKNPGATYLWSTNETSQTISVNSPGEYWVVVTSPEGCEVADTIFASIPVSVNNNKELSCTIYPNPNNGNFNLHIQANAQINGSITIINSLGNIVHTEALNFQNKIIKQMNLDYLAQGMYFAKIEFNNNFHLTKFIIVK